MADLIQGYLREPGEGLLSKLVNDQDGPDGAMTPVEAASNGFLLLVAGHDSTVNTIAHCADAAAQPRVARSAARAAGTDPKAIEEVLRLQSAVQFFPSRSVTADIEIGGTVIPKARRCICCTAPRTATRNGSPIREVRHPRPDNQHVGWGRGVHSCVGGPLARLEVNLAVENFLRRVENPRLVVDPPPYRQNQIFRGPLHLEVEFDRITD